MAPTRVEGVVTGLRERAEPVRVGTRTRIDQIVTFTLICAAEQPQVIMRADEFTGPLFEGDHVSIRSSTLRRPGAAINTVVLRNLSRDAEFGARTGRRLPGRGWLLAGAGVLIALLLVLAVRFLG